MSFGCEQKLKKLSLPADQRKALLRGLTTEVSHPPTPTTQTLKATTPETHPTCRCTRVAPTPYAPSYPVEMRNVTQATLVGASPNAQALNVDPEPETRKPKPESRNPCLQVIRHGRITTTQHRAKAVRGEVNSKPSPKP